MHDKLHFRVTLPEIPQPTVDIWHTLVSCLRHSKCLPKLFYVSQIAGHLEHFHTEERLKLSPDEIALVIKQRDLLGFSVNTGYGEHSIAFQLGDMKECGMQSALWCDTNKNTKIPISWDYLIEAVADQWKTIGSWQWGSLYNSWQNNVNLKYYEHWYGAKPPGLTTIVEKSVCVLSPDQEIVDTSRNPGRHKELLLGIFFQPTAEMWLGPHFWQYAKCTKEEVLAADFFLEKRDTPHFLYLKSWPQPFTRPDGEQGRQQQKIWQLFFHEDCEWPPGSGTICDEPMYGPPELMP